MRGIGAVDEVHRDPQATLELAACATRYARSYVVTLSVDRVIFRQPVHVGELVTFSASVNYTGRTSMEIGIRVDAENIETGQRRHANSSYFTMVAMDAAGQSRPVPKLVPTTETGWQRYESARKRRSAFRDLGPHQRPVPIPENQRSHTATYLADRLPANESPSA